MSDNNLKTDELEELSWIRIFDPVHIPKHLVEQVRDRDWSVERFYEYQKMICLQKCGDEMVVNTLNLLFVLVDKDRKVRGFFWGFVDVLSNVLVINTFSMDKEYWGKGKAVKLLEEKAKTIAEGAQLNKIYWITNYPKHSERYGFKRSENILMEYKMGEENGRDIHGVRCKTSGDCGTNDASSEEISAEHSGWSRSTSDGIISAAAAGV